MLHIGDMQTENRVQNIASLWSKLDADRAAITLISYSLDQTFDLHAVNPISDGSGSYQRCLEQRRSRQFVWGACPARCGEHIELKRLQIMLSEKLLLLFF